MAPAKRRIFRIVTFSIPLLFFISLELFLQLLGYGGNTSLFIPATGDFAAYYQCNPSVGKRYFFMQSSLPDPPNDLFLKDKPANGYRIFVAGGSTTAGYPFEENLMFSRILHLRLKDIFPGKHIEVVNTATAAINSYAIFDFMDEILKHEPDAILLYAGHNEYYGAMGVASTESLGQHRWLVRGYLKLQKFKTFVLLRNLLGQMKKGIRNTFSDGTVTDPTATLMERLVAEQKILYGSSMYERGKRQFAANLSDILKKARDMGIPVFLSELVSNIRDQQPFLSVDTDQLEPADRIYRQAMALEKADEYEAARRKYYEAKDLDALRFRAPEEFNQIIHEIARQYDMPVIAMKEIFESNSLHGIIGDNLMLEHLHPNIRGCFLMASAFLEVLLERNVIDSPPPINDDLRLVRKGYTELDSLFGDLRIRILKGGWPFQPRSVPNKALQQYRPQSKAESLAVRAWADRDFTMERAHFQLAKYHEKKNHVNSALREYQALIALTPLNVSPYLSAADLLIKDEQLSQALPYLYQSLKLEQTTFANKWIGQILLTENKVQEAIPFLERAFRISTNDPQLLYNLSGAYALNSQFRDASKVMEQLNRLHPGFPGANELKRQLDGILDKQ